jgi:hypothetical protein
LTIVSSLLHCNIESNFLTGPGSASY